MSAAADRLKQYVARITRLMDERDGISSDIRDVFAEVKSAGYSGPALRKVITDLRMDPTKRNEIEAMVETYRAAVGLARPEAVEMLAGGKTIRETHRATGVALGTLHRRSKTARKTETEHPHDPATGEITPSAAAEVPRDDVLASAPSPAEPAPREAAPTAVADTDAELTAGENVALAPGSGGGACNLAAPAVPEKPDDGDEGIDAGWERQDGAVTFHLGHAIAGGKVECGEVDTEKTRDVIRAALVATGNARAVAAHDLAEMPPIPAFLDRRAARGGGR